MTRSATANLLVATYRDGKPWNSQLISQTFNRFQHLRSIHIATGKLVWSCPFVSSFQITFTVAFCYSFIGENDHAKVLSKFIGRQEQSKRKWAINMKSRPIANLNEQPNVNIKLQV